MLDKKKSPLSLQSYKYLVKCAYNLHLYGRKSHSYCILNKSTVFETQLGRKQYIPVITFSLAGVLLPIVSCSSKTRGI